jgi:carboxyl-terminal processing protease
MLIDKVHADQEKKLVDALAKIGVDWTAPQNGDAANLDVSVTTSPTIKAGEEIALTATVKNTGTGAAYRVLPRVQADDGMFTDVELPVGKVGAGETKTFTAKLKVPTDAVDRVDRLGLEVHEARNAASHVVPAEVKVEAAPRPVFAYSWQLVDDSNGDGLVQRGEKYKLEVEVKNTGAGPTQEATVLLRNATGDGVTLDKSRIEVKDPILPGQTRDFEFPLSTDATLKADEVVLELMAYDSNLDVQASDKLHFKVQPSVSPTAQHGDVTVKAAVALHAGAADDSSIVGTAPRGASYPAIASFGPWMKVKLPNNRVGFLPTTAVSSGGSGAGNFAPFWNSTPPLISLAAKNLETNGESYKLTGSITDDQHVEDVYVFVANAGAKIDNRKVFYRSNRGGKDGKAMDFATDLPLWPGSNMVTVIARANSEVRSMKTLYIYRDPPRTAQAP